MSKYYVYILECRDGTLYTGYTNNVEKRLKTHNSGKGAKYTRGRCPCILLYYEEFENKSLALKREYEVKQMSRKQKMELVGGRKHV